MFGVGSIWNFAFIMAFGATRICHQKWMCGLTNYSIRLTRLRLRGSFWAETTLILALTFSTFGISLVTGCCVGNLGYLRREIRLFFDPFVGIGRLIGALYVYPGGRLSGCAVLSLSAMLVFTY